MQMPSNEVLQEKWGPLLNYEGIDPIKDAHRKACLLYTSPSPRDKRQSRMPSSA